MKVILSIIAHLSGLAVVRGWTLCKAMFEIFSNAWTLQLLIHANGDFSCGLVGNVVIPKVMAIAPNKPPNAPYNIIEMHHSIVYSNFEYY